MPIRFSDWHNETQNPTLPAEIIDAAMLDAAKTASKYFFLDNCNDTKEIITNYIQTQLHLHIENKNIGLIPSGTAAIFLLLITLKNIGYSRLGITTPIYFSVIESAKNNNLNTSYFHLSDQTSFQTNAIDLINFCANQYIDCLWITDPIFSTGVAWKHEILEEFLSWAENHGVKTIIDRVFLGMFWTQEKHSLINKSSLTLRKKFKNLIVIESPTKKLFLNGAKHSLVFASDTIISSLERYADNFVGSLMASQISMAQKLYSPENHKIFSQLIKKNSSTAEENYINLKKTNK